MQILILITAEQAGWSPQIEMNKKLKKIWKRKLLHERKANPCFM